MTPLDRWFIIATCMQETIASCSRAPLLSHTTAFLPLLVPMKTIDPDDISESLDVAVGSLVLQIRQGSFSRTRIIELSPLDIGTFLGNVGGFWGTWQRERGVEKCRLVGVFLLHKL